jgi:hypothetical protein
MQDQLQAQYSLATTSKDGCNVGNPETALTATAKGGGMRILPVNSNIQIARCVNHFANGKLSPAHSACNGEGIAKAGRWLSNVPKFGGAVGAGSSKIDDQASKQQTTVLRTGDTVYPTRLEVNDSKGEVKFAIITCQQGGDGSQTAYKGELVFQFSKDMFKPENITKIEDTIAEVFSSPNGDQQGQGQQAQGGQQGQDPPPQENQESTCNPEIGQTVNQVVAACGNPASQAKGAATKLIYNYNQPKLKIIFVNGKVSDIE